MNKINTLLTTLILTLFITGCSLNKAGYIQVEKENPKLAASAYIKDSIEIKLINEYNEVYALDEVIVNYGKIPFSALDETLGETLVTSDKEFNEAYIQYSQNGLEKNFLGIEYATYTDEALLSLLAKQYSMDIVIFDNKNNKMYKIDFKTSNIVLSKELRHHIYNGFLETSKYFEARAQDK